MFKYFKTYLLPQYKLPALAWSLLSPNKDLLRPFSLKFLDSLGILMSIYPQLLLSTTRAATFAENYIPHVQRLHDFSVRFAEALPGLQRGTILTLLKALDKLLSGRGKSIQEGAGGDKILDTAVAIENEEGVFCYI